MLSPLHGKRLAAIRPHSRLSVVISTPMRWSAPVFGHWRSIPVRQMSRCYEMEDRAISDCNA